MSGNRFKEIKKSNKRIRKKNSLRGERTSVNLMVRSTSFMIKFGWSRAGVSA